MLTVPVLVSTSMTIVSPGVFANIAESTVMAIGNKTRTMVAVRVERKVRNLMNSLFIR